MSEAVLLIGGAGFVGRALAAALISSGYEVHALSRRANGEMPVGVTFHSADQGDEAVVRPLLAHCRIVFHLAAATTPAETVSAPRIEAEANLLPALRFLDCAQGFPHNRYILMSTGGALYGSSPFASETEHRSPVSFHGASKVALEAYFGILEKRHPGALTILRPSNVFGPGQPLRPGFGIVRTLLERALRRQSVQIYGGGQAVRDYLFIDDLVRACLLTISGPAGVFNIGAGTGTSLNALLETVEEVTGVELVVERKPARASDVEQIVLDVGRARAGLGWTPCVGLKEGVKRTWLSLLP